MIIDYAVISSGNPNTVAEEVRAMLASRNTGKDSVFTSRERWQPHGPMTATTQHVQCKYAGTQRMSEEYRTHYVQAMVLLE